MEEVQADGNDEKEGKVRISIKKPVDLIRLKLDKLMENFDKPVIIPERPKPRSEPTVPEFVRNVMGSSAGAGSGEFHVYRHLRRKEYARQKFIKMRSEAEEKDEAYRKKLEENERRAAEATAKRRAKRLKRKERKQKAKKLRKDDNKQEEKESSSNSESEEESQEEK